MPKYNFSDDKPGNDAKRLQWSRGSVGLSTQVREFKLGRSHQTFKGEKSSARLPSDGK